MALPPTSSKISSDANEVTTFKFDFPNFTGTHTGTLVSLNINSVAGGGTGLASLTANNVILGNGTSAPTFVAPGASGNVLTSNGTTWLSSTPSSGGTVTSVALADGSSSPIFSISGSPVTTSGTLTETLIVQPANKIFAGPTSGGSAQPTFRSLVNSDFPSGASAFVQYTSSKVTTRSSAISNTSFTTFSNSPAFTFTPTITGTYKVYAFGTFLVNAGNRQGNFRVFNTSGGATLLSEDQASSFNGASATVPVITEPIQSVYTLTAGTSYVFDIQGEVDNASGVVEIAGDFAPFYMHAEGIGLAALTSFTSTYWNGYSPASTSNYWSLTSNTITDWTTNGTPTITQLSNNGFGTVTIASSNRPGVAFTAPQTGTIKVTFNASSNASTTTQLQHQLIETTGSTIFGVSGGWGSNNQIFGGSIIWGYLNVVSGTTYNIVIQSATASPTALMGDFAFASTQLNIDMLYVS
jgi:hypothetical protein